jgi:outer membrane autotransporter protein
MYGATNFDRWYAHAALSYAAHDFDSTRDTGVTGIAKGAFSGYQYGWRVGAGIPMRSGGLRINPQAGLDWSRLHLRSYSESGAGALSLNVASQTVERIRSRVGVRVSWETEVVASKIVPLIQAYWNHEFRKPPAAAAAFVGGGSSFVTPLQPVSRDSIKLGAGAIVSNKKSYEAELRYELDLAHKFVGHNILASARWSF